MPQYRDDIQAEYGQYALPPRRVIVAGPEAPFGNREARFRAVFEHAPTGLATLDASLRMLDVNGALAALLGESPERLTGRTLAEVAHPDDAHLVDELRPRKMGGEVANHDTVMRLVRRGGDVVRVRVRVTLLGGESGRPRYGFALVDDLTENKGAERSGRELDSLHALLERLSARERHILEHLAAGRTNRQIAGHLSLSEKTVSNYVSRLLAKLGMRRRSEAAAFAARLEEQQRLQARG